jgi:protein O-GlcNAc transferase
MTASVLTAVGLADLVGGSLEDYCRLASTLPRDQSRRAEMRRSLRERMLASPLCDGATFTRDLEAAYRQMWGRSCERRYWEEGKLVGVGDAPLNRETPGAPAAC